MTLSPTELPPDAIGAPGWREAGLRYFKYSHFLRQRFGGKVHRVTVDGGFTCPNVDGTVAFGGCVYCDNRSFSPNRRAPRIPIIHQVEKGIQIVEEIFEPEVYLAYFQAATNTYASLEKLKRLYDEALANPKIGGLIVGTRPDCVGNDVLDLLQGYADRYFVAIEYGLQSVNQRSLDWMNRGHDVDCFFDAVERTKGRGIDISAHVILGLPAETRKDMLATIDAVNQSGVDGIKLHNLHVVEDTPMAEMYRRGEIPVMTRDEYVDLIIDVLEHLSPNMVIHRLTGDAPRDYLIEPQWVLRKAEFLYAMDQEMLRRDSVQGKALPHPAGY
ncbi:MAG: TIGR01212 family radical SAM protein [Planctomycetota bacterium]